MNYGVSYDDHSRYSTRDTGTTRPPTAQGLGVEVFAASLPEKAAQAAFSTPIPTAMAKDMVELFAPVRGLDLDFERDRDAGREINL